MNGHKKHLNYSFFYNLLYDDAFLLPLWLTFAGGVDVDDLFASVDERLLNLIEFSAKRIIEVMLTKKKNLWQINR